MGQPGQKLDMSVITVTLLVEDHLGTKVVALNRYRHLDLTVNGKIKNKSKQPNFILQSIIFFILRRRFCFFVSAGC